MILFVQMLNSITVPPAIYTLLYWAVIGSALYLCILQAQDEGIN